MLLSCARAQAAELMASENQKLIQEQMAAHEATMAQQAARR